VEKGSWAERRKERERGGLAQEGKYGFPIIIYRI
jgi:hypothetical protein